ncbi:MAG: uncharacterized protein KVP18_003398 [Porospora cf. gigantea A]|uniref:uncharacterized protein n=1 Tax=Porospora cf. gigantea A TaxID=2853593 RepID=UPI003559AA30|nr:MAG: hypothetical protein KVP18_003398 [Porospora cf. gigantea A]
MEDVEWFFSRHLALVLRSRRRFYFPARVDACDVNLELLNDLLLIWFPSQNCEFYLLDDVRWSRRSDDGLVLAMSGGLKLTLETKHIEELERALESSVTRRLAAISADVTCIRRRVCSKELRKENSISDCLRWKLEELENGRMSTKKEPPRLKTFAIDRFVVELQGPSQLQNPSQLQGPSQLRGPSQDRIPTMQHCSEHEAESTPVSTEGAISVQIETFSHHYEAQRSRLKSLQDEPADPAQKISLEFLRRDSQLQTKAKLTTEALRALDKVHDQRIQEVVSESETLQHLGVAKNKSLRELLARLELT